MKGKNKKKATGQIDYKTALIKKALGYDAVETIEEYAEEQGEIKLLKKKVTTKNVQPDITALKILLENEQTPVSSMTDEQLEQEKVRLIQLLALAPDKEN